MTEKTGQMAARFANLCRDVAVMVIAGLYRARPISEINEAVKARPIAQQAMITLGVLGALLGFSLIAAQIGWVAMLIYWLGLILLVN